MIDNDQLVPSAVNDELGDTSTVTDEQELNLDEDLDEEQDEFHKDPDVEEWEPQQKPQKDYKQKFNSAMSNLKKLERENEQLKRASVGKLSDDDLASLRDKYDEEDLTVIEKIVAKKLNEHESSKLAQREENKFLQEQPEVTDAQLKHLKWMQKEFGYSLKYAHDITFGTKQAKVAPQQHSISGWSSAGVAAKAKQETDESAYSDMKKFYNA